MFHNTRFQRQFEAIRNDHEELLWVGQPAWVPFLISGLPFLAIGLVWGAIDYFGFIRHMSMDEAGFAIPFFALHLFPLWASVLNMVRLVLVHGNTFYAYSDKRMMMRSGFWGTDFKTIDYDQISDIEVTVNPIENMYGVGTVRAFSGRTTSKGGRVYDRFVAIPDPYTVFKHLKEVSVDFKADLEYPNAMRPETNPGYNTRYDPQR